MLKPISFAYSPDSDDAFMIYAMKEQKIDLRGYSFEFITADIQKLNSAAREGVYDISAISVAAFPDIADDYYLMPIGASVGDNFGPAVIVRGDSLVADVSGLRGKKIAVPGVNTSAYYAARLVIEGFEVVPLAFHEISAAVETGKVDAGILIHELQLDCEAHGFKKLADLGVLWNEKFHLPLPLGANVIRKALGDENVSNLIAIYRESIEWGLSHRQIALAEASEQAFAGLTNEAMADRYISMYVNERSLSVNDDMIEAMDLLCAASSALSFREHVFTR